MPTRTSTLVSLFAGLAVIAPAAAPAAIPNPQSDAAMRKAIRDYARYGMKDATVRATKIKVDCVQATEIGSTRPCSGTFSLTRNGKTAHYKLTKRATTFRNSPGSMIAHLRATATKKAARLPASIAGSSILQ